jgi:hypothetical protein
MNSRDLNERLDPFHRTRLRVPSSNAAGWGYLYLVLYSLTNAGTDCGGI